MVDKNDGVFTLKNTCGSTVENQGGLFKTATRHKMFGPKMGIEGYRVVKYRY